ncbi:Nuclear pore complex protein Nup93 [Blattella germanica]|nr:Nuclear pore complex protein Nup93 [Blattella germanica]
MFKTMSESDFNELLHAAEQLSAEVEGSGDLPKVERTLRQVLDASTELWSRVAQTGAQDIQAHLLLGSKGVDLPQLSQKLEVLSARKTFEPLEPVPDADVQSFLKNEKENAILSIIEETHRTCFEDTEKLQWAHIESEWKQEKQKALNALAGTSEEFLNLTLQPEVMNVFCIS